MASSIDLPSIVSGVYKLLEPLEPTDRAKVVRSALTLLGDDSNSPKSSATGNSDSGADNGGAFGTKATRWMSQNGIDESVLGEIFHKDGTEVEIIVNDVPGEGKRGKSQNCYLLSGIRSFLESDEAKFSESDAVSLCKHMGCHDSANHAKTRVSLGNLVAGTKTSGYTLPAPGLRAAAELVKKMATSA
ncbi:hypothetical protein [Rhodanobacter sp. C05]|uniref:hypothetical protein n=1 Tax=Rhodanobacter sp. C05 TaxID=1945855 RepID=UPI0009878D79|nr:hypothetical protein [Rhodanobacter sp. C05]OOG37111.1 hypothetical protein B0E51_17590 [Rhodanobacter sp. C05]